MNSIRNRAEEIIKTELIFVEGGAHDDCAETDAETCPSPSASAADSGTVGGHLPTRDTARSISWFSRPSGVKAARRFPA